MKRNLDPGAQLCRAWLFSVAKLVIFITIFHKSGDKKSGGDGGDKVVINEKKLYFSFFFHLN